MKKIASAFAGVAFLIGAAIAAFAQSYPPPMVTTVNPTDLVKIIPGGNPAVGDQYAYAAQIAGVPAYQYAVPLTAFSIQVLNPTKRLFLNPAGTLATGTVLFPLQPSDRQELCIVSTQTQTALTVTAATGTSISALAIGAVTALTAGTSVCWFYNAPLTTWFRYA